jgi:hypothetical protein
MNKSISERLFGNFPPAKPQDDCLFTQKIKSIDNAIDSCKLYHNKYKSIDKSYSKKLLHLIKLQYALQQLKRVKHYSNVVYCET